MTNNDTQKRTPAVDLTAFEGILTTTCWKEEISALIADLEATRAERDEVIENNYKDLRVLADNRKLILIIRKMCNISCYADSDQCDVCPYHVTNVHKNGAGASLCPFVEAVEFMKL